MTIKFFKSSSDFRKWLEANHARAPELWVGFYKKTSGRSSITWPESVDQALCFGWIDGIRKSIDDISYKIRFTPRKPTSVWSTVNVRRALALTNQGLMHSKGLEAFEKRKDNRSGIYSYEQRTDAMPEPYAQKLRANKAAWDFFQTQVPSYRKVVSWWVVSAKKEETRQKRLDKLIEDSAQGRTIDQYTRLQKSK
ncbi:MAG TPA: YdeI/OmpD-associated family protein [Isosphaeraceae bacterium]|nr:YdeI/OmpD-associated family protein [Isosphaeraceae bacterium]